MDFLRKFAVKTASSSLPLGDEGDAFIATTGEVRIADLESSLVGEVFLPLRNIEMFKRFTVKFDTVTWENEADLAPEYLYEISKAA